jgi:hypothetical protein
MHVPHTRARAPPTQDRYYGINDPVANKMLRRFGDTPKLEPPEDKCVCGVALLAAVWSLCCCVSGPAPCCLAHALTRSTLHCWL